MNASKPNIIYINTHDSGNLNDTAVKDGESPKDTYKTGLDHADILDLPEPTPAHRETTLEYQTWKGAR